MPLEKAGVRILEEAMASRFTAISNLTAGNFRATLASRYGGYSP
jgi:hypothetical protein